MKHSLVGAMGPPAGRFSDMSSVLDSPLQSNVWNLAKACDVLIPDKASKRFLFSSTGSFVAGCTGRNHLRWVEVNVHERYVQAQMWGWF